jgi:uncharacterized membrane protein YkvA (DUF1232 family)
MIKKEIVVLYYGLRDPRTPFYSKIPALFSILYLLSPVDLIPDFIPLVGYLDDLVIVPLLLNLSIRLLPVPVREDSLLKAAKNKRWLRVAFLMLILLAVGLLAGIFLLFRKWFTAAA